MSEQIQGGTYGNDKAVYHGSSEVNTKAIPCFSIVRFSQIGNCTLWIGEEIS